MLPQTLPRRIVVLLSVHKALTSLLLRLTPDFLLLAVLHSRIIHLVNMAAEKDFKDHDVMGHVFNDPEHLETARGAALHHGQLSAEELEIEKKLRRKIDLRIMPVLITIYLMNYIDRCARLKLLREVISDILQKQLCCSTSTRSGGRPWSYRRAVPDWSFHFVCWVRSSPCFDCGS